MAPETLYTDGVVTTDVEPEKTSLKVLFNGVLESAGFVSTKLGGVSHDMWVSASRDKK